MILAQNKGLSGLSHYLCHLFLATDHRYCCQWIEFMWWSWSFIVCMCFTRYKMAARNTKMWIVKNILYHFLIDNLAEVLYDPWGWMKTDTRDVKWKIFVSEVWGWSGTINSESAKCCCLLSAVCCRLKNSWYVPAVIRHSSAPSVSEPVRVQHLTPASIFLSVTISGVFFQTW